VLEFPGLAGKKMQKMQGSILSANNNKQRFDTNYKLKDQEQF